MNWTGHYDNLTFSGRHFTSPLDSHIATSPWQLRYCRSHDSHSSQWATRVSGRSSSWSRDLCAWSSICLWMNRPQSQLVLGTWRTSSQFAMWIFTGYSHNVHIKLLSTRKITVHIQLRLLPKRFMCCYFSSTTCNKFQGKIWQIYSEGFVNTLDSTLNVISTCI